MKTRHKKDDSGFIVREAAVSVPSTLGILAVPVLVLMTVF